MEDRGRELLDGWWINTHSEAEHTELGGRFSN